jgi:tetratricopeptide (TPR) repeat protein
MATLDAEAAARLRSLGYVGGPSGSRRRTFGLADDPKRLVGLNERFTAALTAFDERRPDEALAAFRSILLERPDFVPARTSAATALVAVGRRAEAVQLLRAAPRDQLESPELLAKLGAALRDSGDLRGAAAAFERARAGGDRNPELLDNLAVAYAALGRSADARALFKELVARPPTAATTWYNYGLFELQSGAPGAAADAFRRAVQREPAYGEAWQALGAALVKIDRPAAMEAWRQAERLVPDDYDLLFNLAMLAAQGDKPADALPYLRRFAREAPRDRYARDIERAERTIASLVKDTSARPHD